MGDENPQISSGSSDGMGSSHEDGSYDSSSSTSSLSDDDEGQQLRIRALEARSSVLRTEQESLHESNNQIHLILQMLVQSLIQEIEPGQPMLALGQLKPDQLQLLHQLIAIEDRLAQLRAQIGAESDTALAREMRRADAGNFSSGSDNEEDPVIPIDNARLEQRLQELLLQQRQQHLGQVVSRIEDDEKEEEEEEEGNNPSK